MRLVDLESTERDVSLDIDVADLRRRCGDYGIPVDHELIIPLGVIPKGLLLDFDLSDASGVSMPVMSRIVDSAAALAVITSIIKRELPLGSRDPSQAVMDRLRRMVFDFPEPADTDSDDPDGQEAEIGTAQPEGPAQGKLASPAWTEKDERDWQTLEDHASVGYWMSSFRDGFMLMTAVSQVSGRMIIKFRRLEVDTDDDAELLRSSRSANWLSAGAWAFYPRRPSHPVVVRAGNIVRADSEHLRIVSPSGTFFASPALLVPPAGAVMEVEYAARIGAGRAVFNLRNQEGEDYRRPLVYFVGALLPEMRGFQLPIRLFMAITSLLLTAGAASEVIWKFLTRLSEDLDPAIAVLLTLPTLFLAFAVRDGEHPTRRRLLSLLRGISLLSLVPLAAGALVLFIDPKLLSPVTVSLVWAISAATAASLAIWFWVLTARISAERTYADGEASFTSTWTIEGIEEH